MKTKHYTPVISHLRAAGVRPTKQRIALGKILFTGNKQHFTADNLYREASKAHIKVSLATIYNTLHEFTAAGLLREVVIDPSRRYFDTNVLEHQHFFFEDSNELVDINIEEAVDVQFPAIPVGKTIRCVDVIVRVSG